MKLGKITEKLILNLINKKIKGSKIIKINSINQSAWFMEIGLNFHFLRRFQIWLVKETVLKFGENYFQLKTYLTQLISSILKRILKVDLIAVYRYFYGEKILGSKGFFKVVENVSQEPVLEIEGILIQIRHNSLTVRDHPALSWQLD